MFNWCSVAVLLNLEILTFEACAFKDGPIEEETGKPACQGLLEYLGGRAAGGLVGGSAPDIDILKVITEPLTHYVIQVMNARLTFVSMVPNYKPLCITDGKRCAVSVGQRRVPRLQHAEMRRNRSAAR